MSKNQIYDKATQLEMTVPSGKVSGDPVVVGQIPGVCLTDRELAGPAIGQAVVKMNGAADLSVKGIDGGGNSAVVEGDILYYVEADTPKISKKATGVRYGYALAAVGSGLTATIRVKIGY